MLSNLSNTMKAITYAVYALAAWAMASPQDAEPLRCIMYLTGQHNVVPEKKLVEDISHVILAFMRSDVFNVDETPDEFPLFTTVEQVRLQFAPSTKVTVAIGGWGDNDGWEVAARNRSSRKRWAGQVAAMVDVVGADGVDIDWEYPGGNRDDYKLIPNSKRVWEIEAYVQLIEELRASLGPNKIISAAVPGKECDLMAFTTSTIPRLIQNLDFLNVMTYDLMNRRDNVTKHHSGVKDSRQAVERYISRGAPVHKVNLGLGYYAKWYMTQECNITKPIGCPTELLEDPVTGADMGKCGSFSWHDVPPKELKESFARAQVRGFYDVDGSFYHWDRHERRWWSFDTADSIETKFDYIVEPLELGGVFAWGLGEDAPDFEHLQATIEQVRKLRGIADESEVKDEL